MDRAHAYSREGLLVLMYYVLNGKPVCDRARGGGVFCCKYSTCKMQSRRIDTYFLATAAKETSTKDLMSLTQMNFCGFVNKGRRKTCQLMRIDD